jgi:hypothetical protein
MLVKIWIKRTVIHCWKDKLNINEDSMEIAQKTEKRMST